MSMKKISTELAVIGILKESKLKDEYVTNKKMFQKEGYCDIFSKWERGNYEHSFGHKYKETYLNQCFIIKKSISNR